MPRSMDEHPSMTYCETHHWVSTNVPGLLTRWIIQCSLCGAYNIQEMNNTLYELVAEALENAADDLPYLDRPSNILVRQQDTAYWLRDRAADIRDRDKIDGEYVPCVTKCGSPEPCYGCDPGDYKN